MTVSVTVLGIAVALLGVLVVGLLRSHAEVLRRLHELGAGVYDDDLPDPARQDGRVALATADPPVIRTREGVAPPRPADTPAHDIAGASPRGEAVAVGIVGTGHTTLVAFLTTGCSTCAGFWSAFAGGAPRDLPDLRGEGIRLVIVTRGPEQESPAEVERLAPPGVTTVMSTSAFDDYAVPVNPYFILVDGPGGRVVGEGAAATWAQVAGLLGRAAADQGVGLAEVGERPEPVADRRDDGFADLRGDGYDDEVIDVVELEDFEELEDFVELDDVGELDDYDDELEEPGYEDEDGYDDEDGDDLDHVDEVPARAAGPEEITIDDGGWVVSERPRGAGLDSRQRDALAEAELFVAGIGPGHPSLYPDRLTGDTVITEDP